MSIYVITVATHNKGYLEVLKTGCENGGMQFIILGYGEKWGGLIWKFHKMREFLNSVNLQSDDLIVFVDGYDTLCINSANRLKAKFYALKTNILISQDIKYVNSPLYDYFHNRIFGNCNNDYINTGMYMGFFPYVKKLINTICTKSDCLDAKLNDQVEMTKLCKVADPFYIANVKIDTENTIFLNLVANKLNIHDNDIVKATNCDKLTLVNGNDIVFVSGPNNTDLSPILKLYNFEDTGLFRNRSSEAFIKIGDYAKYVIPEIIIITLIILIILFFIFKRAR